jgi:hypothetical protein
MKRFILMLGFFVLTLPVTIAQVSTQNIRGHIIDNISHMPLPGATIMLIDTTLQKGVVSDIDGYFVLDNVPIGRISIKITYVGYNDVVLNNILLISGKETNLEIAMEEKIITTSTVVITANRDDGSVNNDMTTVSTRSFSVEESQRYAGARNDVARMASGFAGVNITDDSRNDIIIRGNSPMGLLWRLDGVDIFNPNHFGATGSTGGPVSMLNNNVLSNSDFLMAAFPAEYGNAVSGVFDLRMRSGNSEKHEFMGQIGFNGFETGAEGPISRKNHSSYLVNMRYSTLGVFKTLGVDFGTGTAIPEYMDGTWKIAFPSTKIGSIEWFGLAGKSHIEFMNSEVDTTNVGSDFYTDSDYNLINGSTMAISGIVNVLPINRKSYLKNTASASWHQFTTDVDSIKWPEVILTPYYRNDFRESRLMAKSEYINKLSSRFNIRIGTEISNLGYNLKDSVWKSDSSYFLTLRDQEGSTCFLQTYGQGQWKPTGNITVNGGVYFQQLVLNNANRIEPRLGLRWQIGEKTTFTAGYGRHSNMMNLLYYFTKSRLPDGSYVEPNLNLGFMKADHYVLGWEYRTGVHSKLKTEIYYEDMFDVPVDAATNNSFSMLNEGASFENSAPDSLKNAGNGKNYGIELTIERYLNKGWYYLATASLYESKYAGSDGVEHSTAFDGNYVLNLLAGKEISWKNKKGGQNSFIFDVKVTYAGGQRYTPYDVAATVALREEKYMAGKDFTEQYKNYFRTDIKIGYRRSVGKMTMEWNLDAQNALNIKNIYSQKINVETGEISYLYQLGRLIIPQFRIEF